MAPIRGSKAQCALKPIEENPPPNIQSAAIGAVPEQAEPDFDAQVEDALKRQQYMEKQAKLAESEQQIASTARRTERLRCQSSSIPSDRATPIPQASIQAAASASQDNLLPTGLEKAPSNSTPQYPGTGSAMIATASTTAYVYQLF